MSSEVRAIMKPLVKVFDLKSEGITYKPAFEKVVELEIGAVGQIGKIKGRDELANNARRLPER